MRSRIWVLAWALGVFATSGLSANAALVNRVIPRPLPAHPGNIFLAGEKITVAAPPGEVDTWRAVSYENKVVAKGQFKDGRAEVGDLPVGWYKIVRGKGQITNRVFVAVIEPLLAPTPLTSPISIDVAMAWFYPNGGIEEVASLCRLAGINWVRDRLTWEAMEPRRGTFAAPNQYDKSAQVQTAAGLQVLQVCHISPSWANPNSKCFPHDLRDVYNFYREMARRWRGRVPAFEPWNEADIPMFGGHTGSEMATLQKAAYLGLKAGNPDVIACLNVFAIRRAATLKDFGRNEAWPYFDRFNLHNYEPLTNYPSLFADFRAVSGGKPLWVTETSMHVKWRGNEQLKELGDDDLRLQSEQLVKTYVESLHEGAEQVFYFMLPHYTESWLQYGILRPDFTPRPAYVSLTAVGRLLADAKSRGRVKSDDPAVHGYVFDARPDGCRVNVLVAWADGGAQLKLSHSPESGFDHLGRAIAITNGVLNLSRAPVFAFLTRGACPELVSLPEPAKLLPGKPGSIVIQAVFPEQDIVVKKSAFAFKPDQTKSVPVCVYNFGPQKASGRLSVKAPEHWSAELPAQVEVAPGERKELSLNLRCGDTNQWSLAHIRIDGDFGDDGRPMVAFQFTPPASTK